MLKSNLVSFAVEISYLAALHRGEPKCQSRTPGIDAIEINKGRQPLLERIDEIHCGPLDPDRRIDTQRQRRVDVIKSGHAYYHGSHLRPGFRQATIQPLPKLF